MSHLIENNMIAWKGEAPWHGLGVKVTNDMTGLQMLQASKMDWKVQRRALAMRSSDGTGLITDSLSEFRAIVREDTNEVFQVATNRYHPIQNQQVVEFFREFCEAGHATMDVVGGLKGGAIVWALAKLNGNGASDCNIGGVDPMKGYMLMVTSHDGSLRTICQATDIRGVCWNTISAIITDKSNQFMMKHSSKWTPARADEAKRVMGMATIQIQQNHELFNKLAKVAVDDKGREEYVIRLLGGESLLAQVAANTTGDHAQAGASVLDSIVNKDAKAKDGDASSDLGRLGKAILEAIVTSPGSELITAKNTLWGAINGVTYHVDHERGRSQDTRLAGAWFGDGDRLKRDAVKVACDMAGIEIPKAQAVFA